MLFWVQNSQPAGDHSSSELLNELSYFFNLPMSTADRVLGLFIFFFLVLIIILLTVRTIKFIWKGNSNRRKLL